MRHTYQDLLELPGQWTFFAGLDWVDRDSAESVSAYRQDGVRLGFLKQLEAGMQIHLFTSFRRREHDAFSQLLDARRRDDISNYFLTLKFPQLAFREVVPTLAIEHTRVKSNVDWLYSYRESVVSLKFEWRL